MEKEFVPYKLAVKLKELGFNEECLCVYYTNTFTGDEGLKYKLIIGHGNIEFANDLLINTQKYTNSTVVNYYVTAPLWQQAFNFITTKLSNVFEYNDRYRLSFELGYWMLYDEYNSTYCEDDAALELLITILSKSK